MLLLACCAGVRAQEARPDADALVELAWRFVPEYADEHRFFLTETQERETLAGTHLFAAALALEPDHLRGLWSLGHAWVLLAEDARNRGEMAQVDDPAARKYYESSVAALDHAIEIAPDDPWSRYARGAAHAAFGEHAASLADLARAVELCDASLRNSPADEAVARLRFRALEWRIEVLMRAFEFDRARGEMQTFHAEFSNNSFPLRIAVGESYMRERDFASARAAYEQITAEFPHDFQAYSLLGYLAGLVGDPVRASEQLAKAVKLESQPGVYARLWYWLLATDEARPAAEADLRLFLENPPPDLSEWDRNLGLFSLGEGDVDAFVASGRAELERRMAATEAPDDLPCEVWFYAGARYEHDAALTGDETARTALLGKALAAYRSALSFSPVNWKWEWGFARLRFATLAQDLGLALESDFTVVGNQLHGPLSGHVRGGRWHAPGSEQPTATLDRAPRAGDLFMAVLEREGSPDMPLRRVVGVVER